MIRATFGIANRFTKFPLPTLLGFGLAMLLLFAGAGNARAEDQIEVKLDQAQVLQLPANTSIVVLGNPIIADVTLIRKSNSMILTGKSYGETNLIALDKDGHTVGESMVRVAAPSTSLVVQLGTARQTYSCDPRCEPSFSLGDDSQFASGVSGEIQSRNSLAQPAGH
jgi:Flp pilus assembly secretin CpaC